MSSNNDRFFEIIMSRGRRFFVIPFLHFNSRWNCCVVLSRKTAKQRTSRWIRYSESAKINSLFIRPNIRRTTTIAVRQQVISHIFSFVLRYKKDDNQPLGQPSVGCYLFIRPTLCEGRQLIGGVGYPPSLFLLVLRLSRFLTVLFYLKTE